MKKQQGPGPRFQDLQYDRGTNLHVKGIRGCCSPRLFSITSQKCSPAKNAKHSERVAWICGAATIPSDATSANERAGEKRSRGPAVAPLDLKVFLWT